MKKIIWTLLKILISVGILGYIFTRPDSSPSRLADIISHSNGFYLIASILLYGVIIFLTFLRWDLLLKAQDIHLSFIDIVRYSLIGLFFSNILPSVTGGDVVKAYYVIRKTTHTGKVILSILLDRMLGFFALIFYGFVGSFLVISKPAFKSMSTFIIIICIVGLVILAMLYTFRQYWKSLHILNKIFKKLHLLEKLQRIYNIFKAFKNKPMSIVGALILSFLVQGIIIFINYLLAVNFGMSKDLLIMFFVIIPMASIISAIPISMAGWGIGEGAYRQLFGLLGTGFGSIAVAVSVVVRLFALFYGLLGLPFYIALKNYKISDQDMTKIENSFQG